MFTERSKEAPGTPVPINNWGHNCCDSRTNQNTNLFMSIYVPSNNCLNGDMAEDSVVAVGCEVSSSTNGPRSVFFCFDPKTFTRDTMANCKKLRSSRNISILACRMQREFNFTVKSKSTVLRTPTRGKNPDPTGTAIHDTGVHYCMSQLLVEGHTEMDVCLT